MVQELEQEKLLWFSTTGGSGDNLPNRFCSLSRSEFCREYLRDVPHGNSLWIASTLR